MSEEEKNNQMEAEDVSGGKEKESIGGAAESEPAVTDEAPSPTSPATLKNAEGHDEIGEILARRKQKSSSGTLFPIAVLLVCGVLIVVFYVIAQGRKGGGDSGRRSEAIFSDKTPEILQGLLEMVREQGTLKDAREKQLKVLVEHPDYQVQQMARYALALKLGLFDYPAPDKVQIRFEPDPEVVWPDGGIPDYLRFGTPQAQMLDDLLSGKSVDEIRARKYMQLTPGKKNAKLKTGGKIKSAGKGNKSAKPAKAAPPEK